MFERKSGNKVVVCSVGKQKCRPGNLSEERAVLARLDLGIIQNNVEIVNGSIILCI